MMKRVVVAPVAIRAALVCAAEPVCTVILDLDESLVRAIRPEEDPGVDTGMGAHETIWITVDTTRLGVWFRPGVVDLLRGLGAHPGVRLWVSTLGTAGYAAAVVRALVQAVSELPPGRDGLGPFSTRVVAREAISGAADTTAACGGRTAPGTTKGVGFLGMPPATRCVVLDDRLDNWHDPSTGVAMPVVVPPPFTGAPGPDSALPVFLGLVTEMIPYMATGLSSSQAAAMVVTKRGGVPPPLALHLPRAGCRKTWGSLP